MYTVPEIVAMCTFLGIIVSLMLMMLPRTSLSTKLWSLWFLIFGNALISALDAFRLLN